MNFSERLKEIRNKEGLSQEQLAERIGVSRQAITKWESGKGLPDVENMMIIAEIFKTTIDELLTGSAVGQQEEPEISVYTSDTSVDIDCEKHFDIHVGSAAKLTLFSGTDEKLHVRLSSGTLEHLDEMFKVKLDENRNRLDVDCVNRNKLSRFEAEEALTVEIVLPEKYAGHCEVAASVKLLVIDNLHLRRLEYDGDAEQVRVSNSSGRLEFTAKTDYDITIDRVDGILDVNQWKAKTVVHIPEKNLARVVNRGRKCSVYYRRDGGGIEEGELAFAEGAGENEIRVSGMFSELIVDVVR